MRHQPKERETSAFEVILAVLDAHPTHLTEADIILELVGDHPVFGERDEIENHVRDLIGVGVLRREGGSILPTRPTIYLDEFIAL
jgi:hypothetical protein